MEPKMLDAQYHVDQESGVLCRYVKSDTEYFRPHTHNYYELFMVVKGDVGHIINGKEQLLSEGELLFIRDFDLHDYRSANGDYFEFINLAFSKETFESMLAFWGSGFPADTLLSAPAPPAISLSPKEKEALTFELLELHRNSDKEYVKFKARTLLIKVFSKYFFHYTEETTDIPSWLEITYEKMKRPQNFTAGTGRMYEICGKSREHLTRCMKQYYHTTPAALVTQLRLEHAAKLLLISNLSVTDICYECGFENLSWFYKIFAGKYGMTPAEYRKRLHA